LRKYSKKEQKAEFELFYSFKSAYGLKDMTVSKGMSEFNAKMKNDEKTQKQYWYFRRSGLD
jgi:hypothetical protein